ncbi:MAG TPA: hypothetical protein VIM89_22665 [Mucilaginibacter sp.]
MNYKFTITLALVACSLTSKAQKHAVHNNPITNKWYSLERDSSGYVFYDPCEERIPYVVVSGNKLTWADHFEDPEAFKIVRVSNEKNGRTVFTCKGKDHNLLVNVRWLDSSCTMALWKFKGIGPLDEIKWVMCPANKVARFKVVRCIGNDTVKTPEMTFLPIQIN